MKKAHQVTSAVSTERAPPAAVTNSERSHTLRLPNTGESVDSRIARAAVTGSWGNAIVTTEFSQSLGTVDMTEAVVALQSVAKNVHGGDLRQAETMLVAQASSLNAIFIALARRASANLDGGNTDFAERYLRLAFKAQGQCRTTLETLAVFKQGPTIFAKQANIANGPQQVNNGVPSAEGQARAGEVAMSPNELLETPHGERVDFGAKAEAGAGNPALAPLAKVERPKKRGR